jgi:hypothetical protein
VGADPSEVGSNVAHDGRLAMQRRQPLLKTAAEDDERRIESILIG